MLGHICVAYTVEKQTNATLAQNACVVVMFLELACLTAGMVPSSSKKNHEKYTQYCMVPSV